MINQSARPSRESIMATLYGVLVASVATTFTADTGAGSVILANPSTMKGLFVGLPVFGGSVPRGSVIQNLSPLTISLAPTVNASAVTLTTGFLTTGRRVIPWTKVAAQPALFLRSGDEELTYPNIILQAQTIAAEIWIYSKAGEDPNEVPETALNNLLDAVQAAFTPDDPHAGRFTLGGLVEWCRLEGKVEKDPGDIGGQAIAVADVLITVP
jgi:hypothetical protein